jgi:hypothetical protein
VDIDRANVGSCLNSVSGYRQFAAGHSAPVTVTRRWVAAGIVAAVAIPTIDVRTAPVERALFMRSLGGER